MTTTDDVFTALTVELDLPFPDHWSNTDRVIAFRRFLPLVLN